jgi:IS30 family transposase
METKNYKRLSLAERIIIETLINEKRKKSYIAIRLNRSRSTITREINNWVRRPEDKYDAHLAHWYAQDDIQSRRLYCKLDQFPLLKMAVFRGLLSGCSPELIAGRLRLAYPNDPSMQISYESIYRFIYAHPQGRINMKLIKRLTQHKARRRKPRPHKRRVRIVDRISIDQRPKHIENRQESGHWEGDLMIGRNHGSCIGTLVERKSRYALLVKLPNKKSNTVTSAFASKLKHLPDDFKKSLTYDNGIEMAKHKTFTKKTGMTVYFAHPYSSWERGTNENTNGLVRRSYPKKTDFNLISQKHLDVLQERLNNRPRKVLGFHTPKEIFIYEKLKSGLYDDDIVALNMGNKSPKDLFSFLMPAN